jgi:hypothetical protein
MSTLHRRTQEINVEYWEVREEQSERVAVAQLTLAFARAEAEIATLRAALAAARLELMQDVEPDWIIGGIDRALATAEEAGR